MHDGRVGCESLFFVVVGVSAASRGNGGGCGANHEGGVVQFRRGEGGALGAVDQLCIDNKNIYIIGYMGKSEYQWNRI